MSIYIALATQPALAAATFECLRSLGVAPANLSRREHLSPIEINEYLLKIQHQRKSSGGIAIDDFLLKTLGFELATDLMLANLDHPFWAWWQQLDAYTHVFWQRFDSTARFVLAFSDPAEHLAQVLTRQSDLHTGSLLQLVTTALEDWVADHTSLLTASYSLGTRAILLHASHLAQPEELATVLGLVATTLPENSNKATQKNIVSVQHALLQQVISQHPEVMALWAEMQAVAQLPCPDHEWKTPTPLDTWCELQATLGASQEKVATLQATLDEQTSRQVGCVEDNELLLVQLHQVQEELELFFLKHQTLTEKHRHLLVPLQFVSDFWCTHAPNELWLDARRHLEGQGWYEPEIDGRWTGPETLTTLHLPPLANGSYAIELHIADAMHSDIVGGLQVFGVFSNGSTQFIDLVHECGVGGSVFPVLCIGRLNLPEIADAWQLHMKLPFNICPAEQDGSDTRRLGMRVQGLRLSLSAVDPLE